MNLKNMKRIVPTVWVQNTPDFYKMASLFKENGIDTLRINCTRHNNETYIWAIEKFRKWCLENLGFKFRLLLDLPIPHRKVRIFYLSRGKKRHISKKEEIVIADKQNDTSFFTYDFQSLDLLKEGDKFWVGETETEFIILEKSEHFIKAECTKEGVVGYGKYIYTNQMKYQLCSDAEIIKYCELCNCIEPDEAAFSFINSDSDIDRIINNGQWNSEALKIAKIETNEGIDNISDIINKSEKIMVARGDLFNNVGIGKFAKCCLEVIKYLEDKQMEYYVATGIIESLGSHEKTVTRAELIDICMLMKYKFSKVILTYSVCADFENTIKTLDLLRKLEI